MDTQTGRWLPLTEYALRSGISISTLRRKIKSNTIEYKMEEGRYLIRCDDLEEGRPSGYASSDDSRLQPMVVPEATVTKALVPVIKAAPAKKAGENDEIAQLKEEVRKLQEDSTLRWKALDARVAGLAKKLEFFTEHIAELKMLVKIFEEKLDHRA
jgi:hypothetical protein